MIQGHGASVAKSQAAKSEEIFTEFKLAEF